MNEVFHQYSNIILYYVFNLFYLLIKNPKLYQESEIILSDPKTSDYLYV